MLARVRRYLDKDSLEEEINQKCYTQASGPLCPLARRQHRPATRESPLP
jgi:hypothetical protein